MHVTEDGAVVGSIDRAALAELQGEAQVEAEPKASMALSKGELVDLAVAAGLGDADELELLTKQQLVDDLNAEDEG